MIVENREAMDHRAENTIGILLRTGVTLSALVVLFGGILYLTHSWSSATHYGTFRSEPGDLRHISGIIRDSMALHPAGIIQLGLLLLIATPITRVAFSVWAFAEERDWLYVTVTLIVLALLLFSLAGPHSP
jgi:uncharacterized membrane protein